MGNKTSSPLTDENMEQVQRIIAEILSHFATEFSVHYRDAITTSILTHKNINDTKKDTSTSTNFKLPDCPVPDYLLKSGVICKKGIETCM